MNVLPFLLVLLTASLSTAHDQPYFTPEFAFNNGFFHIPQAIISHYNNWLFGPAPPKVKPVPETVGLRHIDWTVNRTFTENDVQELATTATFKSSNHIVVLYGGESPSDFDTLLRAYRNRSQHNIFVFDSKDATVNADNAPALGVKLGEILNKIRNWGLTSTAWIHIITNGQGNLIAGPSTNEFAKLQGYKIGRVSLLSPPNIPEALRPKPGKISKIDVIHTENLKGVQMPPLGHVDFYPNGGLVIQPGTFCVKESTKRSIDLFAESVIVGNTFPAWQCEDLSEINAGTCTGATNQMGYNAVHNKTGIFTLKTNKVPPFKTDNQYLQYV